MKLSRTELQILAEIAKGNKNISRIAKALVRSKSQVYRSGQKLLMKGFLLLSNGFYEPTKEAYVSLLLRLLGDFPSLVEPFSGSGLKFFIALLEPRGPAELMQEAKLGRAQVFKKIKQARAISLIRYENSKYCLNEKIWSNIFGFLQELKTHEETVDERVPADSIIYFKNEKEIVFSSREDLDASFTGFSAYEQSGIKLLMGTNYYYLPKRKLGKEEVFRHSLLIAEKDFEIRQIILIALFYAKYKKMLKRVKHKISNNIDKIFEGQSIPGYPTLEEINDRAEVYHIKVRKY
jgi:hypothetical protein